MAKVEAPCLPASLIHLADVNSFAGNRGKLSQPATAVDNRGLIPGDDSSNVWYTPMYCMAPWSVRRMIAGMDMFFKSQIHITETKPVDCGQQQLSLF